MTAHPKIIYGAYPLANLSKEEAHRIFALLKAGGVNDLDTARIYPNSEKSLGELEESKDFLIGTKARGFGEKNLSKQNIFQSIDESFKELKTDSVDTYFLHAPDPDTPIEETLEAINELYKQGKFKRFGLSNYSTEGVKKLYEYAKSKDYVLPTVFQGNYNAFSRGIEEDLFPLLRKYGIEFDAYSPIAGGFLVKTVKQIEEGQGRFDKSNMIGEMYSKLYNRPSLMKGLETWGKISEKYEIPKAHLAYRWITFHSALDKKYGDGLIIGGKNFEQISDTLDAIKEGPLPKGAVEEIEEVWQSIKSEAPLNNYVF